MNILYQRGDLIGIRYPYTFIGVVLRVILLVLFGIVCYAFANRWMSWENWVVPILFICGLLSLGISKRKAVYHRKKEQLTVYGKMFNLIGTKYDLPVSKEELELLAQQRVDYSTGTTGSAKALLYKDIFVKLPRKLVQLDSVPVHDVHTEHVPKDWERFFDAIYDPGLVKEINGKDWFRYLEISMWVLILLFAGITLYINQAGGLEFIKQA